MPCPAQSVAPAAQSCERSGLKRNVEEPLSKPQKRRRRLQRLAASRAVAERKTEEYAATADCANNLGERLALVEALISQIHWHLIGQWLPYDNFDPSSAKFEVVDGGLETGLNPHAAGFTPGPDLRQIPEEAWRHIHSMFSPAGGQANSEGSVASGRHTHQSSESDQGSHSSEDIGACDICGRAVEKDGDIMMSCATDDCCALAHYECLGTDAVRAWECFSNDGGTGEDSWHCKACRTAYGMDDFPAEASDDRSDSADSANTSAPNFNEWPDLSSHQQAELQAWHADHIANKKHVLTACLQTLQKEVHQAEAAGDIQRTRDKISHVEEIIARMEDPDTWRIPADELQKQAWAIHARRQ